MSDVTRILESISHGDKEAGSKLLPVVYDELRRLAAQRMWGERADHTLQPTALVHEAWLRLAGDEDVKWDSRAHFFGAAAEAMRRILIDYARRKRAQRHGGGQIRVELDGLEISEPIQEEKILALNEALDKLASHDAQMAELVKLRYFGGITLEEAASMQGLSLSTAKRTWTFARAWLYREIQSSGSS